MNTIDIFRTKISVVHGNLFEVFIQFPTFLGGQLATEQIKFHCRSTTIPSGTSDIIEIPYRGSSIKIYGDNSYPEWSVTILNNRDFNIYKTIQRWREFGRSDILGTRANDFTYKSVATVYQLDGAQNIIYQVALIGLFPTAPSEITLAQDENNSVETFDCSFNYDLLAPELI